MRKINQPKEAMIVAAILKYLRTLPGSFWWKEHGGMYGTAGLPDIVGCYCGRFVAFEVKRPGCKPTALQTATLKKINVASGYATSVTSVDEVKHYISKIQE